MIAYLGLVLLSLHLKAKKKEKKRKHSEWIPDGEGNGRDSSFKCILRLARMEERNLSKSKQVK